MRVVTAQLPDEMVQELDKLAEHEGRSKSWLIRQALAEYLANQKEIERLTLEGLAAVRSGDVIEHADILAELDQWGH